MENITEQQVVDYFVSKMDAHKTNNFVVSVRGSLSTDGKSIVHEATVESTRESHLRLYKSRSGIIHKHSPI